MGAESKVGIDSFQIDILHWFKWPDFTTVDFNLYFLFNISDKNWHSSSVNKLIVMFIPWLFCSEPSCIIQWANPIDVIYSSIQEGTFFIFFLQSHNKMNHIFNLGLKK